MSPNISFFSSAENFVSNDSSTLVVSALVSADQSISVSGLEMNTFALEMYNTSAQISTSAYELEYNVTETGELKLTATDGISTTTASQDVEIFIQPTPLRTSAIKELDIMSLLPVHLEYSEVGQFLQFFEDFLNEMYYEWTDQRGNNDLFTVDNDGVKSYYRISADSEGNAIESNDVVTISGNTSTDTSAYNSTYTVNKSPMISILEKARRLTDLHDPDLIDIEYIQNLSTYLGYDIRVYRSDIEDVGNTSNDYEVQRYLRNIVSNLPSWHRIKSTKNAIKVVLHSFGVIGELVQKWTLDQLSNASLHPTSGGYGDNLALWKGVSETNTQLDLSSVPVDYFPTPHFDLRIDVNTTAPGWIYNINRISTAIDDIRPVQSVFDGFIVKFFSEYDTLYTRIDHYDVVKVIFEPNEDYPLPYENNPELPVLQVSGVGQRGQFGQGSLTFSSVQVSGWIFEAGTGYSEFENLQLSGSGIAKHLISGSIVLENFEIETPCNLVTYDLYEETTEAEQVLVERGGCCGLTSACILTIIEPAGEFERGQTANVALELPSFEVSGVGYRGQEGTGSIELSDVEVDGTANRGRYGTGSIELQGVDVDGTGNRGRYGVSDITLENIDVDGEGIRGQFGQGSIELSLIDIDGTGNRGRYGTGSIELQDVNVNGEGIRGQFGTGSIELQNVDVYGTSNRGRYGSGDIDLQNIDVDGEGIRGQFGTGSIELSNVDLDGIGIRGQFGEGSIELSLIDIDGVGNRGRYGSGDIDLQNIDVDGIGIRGQFGTGSIELQDVNVDGEGIRGQEGTGSIELSDVEVNGTSLNKTVATGDITLSNVDVDGTGNRGRYGTGSIELQNIDVDGTGFRGQGSTGDITLSNIDVDGEGFRGQTGTGSIELSDIILNSAGITIRDGSGFLLFPSFEVAGVGFRGQSGTGSIELSLIDIDGTGKRGQGTTGDITLSNIDVDGEGFRGQDTTGDIDLQNINVDGTGNRGRYGTGSIELQNIDVDGEGFRGQSGTGSIELFSVEIDGEGFRGQSGSGSIELSNVDINGTANRGRYGTGDIDLQNIDVDGEGIRGQEGTGSIELQDVDVDGTGNRGRYGTGSIELSTISLTSSGDVKGGTYIEIGEADDLFIEGPGSDDTYIEDGL